MRRKTKNHGYHHDYLSQRLPPRTEPDELRPLYDLIIKGDEDARKRLIEGHLRLALNIASRYSFFGADFEEVSSAAMVGVCTAVERIKDDKVEYVNLTGYIIKYTHQHCYNAVRMDTCVPMPRGQKPVAQTGMIDVTINDDNLTEVADVLDAIVETEEEGEVIALRAEGRTDQQVADLMCVDRSKVTRIRQRLLKRYDDACN